MDTKPTYIKFHDFDNKTIAYWVKHPLFTEANLYPDVRQTEGEWLCYLPGSDAMYSGGKTRTAAVDGMLKYAEKLVRGTRLRDAWYQLEQELVQSSTAWHALYAGRENADDTVVEGNVDDDSTEYWELAWSGYNSLMDELEAADRELARSHNLIDLPVCNWCGQHTTDGKPINSDEVFCPACLPIATLSHEWDSLDEEEQESKDAKRAAAEYADETVADFDPKRWFELALSQYAAMTGEATSVAEIASTPVGTSEGMQMYVGEDEHGDVHVRLIGQNITYGWLRAAAAAKKWTGGLKVQQVSAASSEFELRFIFRYEA